MKFTKPIKQPKEAETLGVRIPTDRAEAFRAEAKRDGVSVSEAIRQLIENFLKLRGK